MSRWIIFKNPDTQETLEAELGPAEISPKVNDRITSPFDQGRTVTVLEVVWDAPRNRTEFLLGR